VTRDASVAERYIVALEKEIALLSRHFDRRRRVTQLHWGGGTPTFLSPAELTRLMHGLAKHFSLIDSPEREYSIEIDPRSVDTGTIALLKGLGFNRLSMGIQDFDPDVQRAINRIQPFDMVEDLVQAVREQRFKSLSFDLIYGLPLQGPASMEQTLARVIALDPDRISCYSYAHLPDVFSSQRSIDRMQLPGADEKLEILHTIIDTLTDAGYLYVGMDHCVKPQDELAKAMHDGTLQRNFQGYSTHGDCDIIGLGMSAISRVGDSYSQNAKDLVGYYAAVDHGHLPTVRGLRLSDDDLIRRDAINRLMCHGAIDLRDFEAQHRIDFAVYFAGSLDRLHELAEDGLVQLTPERILVTPRGRFLLRTVAMAFDAWLSAPREGAVRYSRTI